MTAKKSDDADRVRALEERVAYLESLVRELLARPQPPVQVFPVLPPLPAPVLPLNEPWRYTPHPWGPRWTISSGSPPTLAAIH